MAFRVEETPGEYVPILGHKCFRCDHAWRPININKHPRVCPKCKSPYWDKPRNNKVKNQINKKLFAKNIIVNSKGGKE